MAEHIDADACVHQEVDDKPKTSLKLAEKPECKPLKFGQIPRVVDTCVAAFYGHPFARYVWFDVPDLNRSPILLPRWRASNWVSMFFAVQRGEAWAINGGEGIIEYSVAPSSLPRWKQVLRSVQSSIKGFLHKCMFSLNSKEQKKREKENHEKMEAAVKTAFGDEVDDMLSIDALGTDPEKQGLGYGSMLVKHVTALVSHLSSLVKTIRRGRSRHAS